jgi:hypothetical protein
MLLYVNEGIAQQENNKQPIIDAHMHTYQWNRYGDPPPPNYISREIPSARTDTGAIKAYLEVMERYNIVLAVGSAQLEMVKKWDEYAPGKFFCGLQFPRNTTHGKPRVTEWPDIEYLRDLYESGQLQVMGEILAQYAGVPANDPKLEPYFALAEELDIPVCFHTGFGEPMVPYTTDPEFRMRYGNPLLLEDVLVKHPKLRIYIAHGGYPFLEETIALMMIYQQVYMDISAINWILPRQEFHDYLQRLFRVYLGKRIMFGSDQMIWPDAVGMGIKAVESAGFLSENQKRDIFYNNAVKFLRLANELNNK